MPTPTVREARALPATCGLALAGPTAAQSSRLASKLYLPTALLALQLPAGMADQIAETIDDLNIRLDVTPSGPVVMDLCRRHNLTAYDALYLEAALRHGGRLASLDRALLRAAEAEGVATLA